MKRLPAQAHAPGRISPRGWLLIAAVYVSAMLLDVLQAWVLAAASSEPVSWRRLVYEGVQWLNLGATALLVYVLGRRYPLDHGRWPRALPLHIAGALLSCVGWTFSGFGFRSLLGLPEGDALTGENFLKGFLGAAPFLLVLYFTILGSLYAFFFFSTARRAELQAAELKSQLTDARLSALRMQLNPHFLFNSLNALLVMVRDGHIEGAARTIELLGDMLRQVLRPDLPNEVDLETELGFIRRYLAIEASRFPDRLNVRWHIDEQARSARVPTFILQPLVENAIRHGVARRSDATRIDIVAEAQDGRLHLRVIDDGPGFADPAPANFGIGLSNTRERLRSAYGDEATVDIGDRSGGGVEARLTLPLRRRPS